IQTGSTIRARSNLLLLIASHRAVNLRQERTRSLIFVVNHDRVAPKEGYFLFQSYWSDKPMVHIYGHSWPIRWGDKGQRKMVKVYSNCGSVELFLNGGSCGARTRNSEDFPAAGLRWMVKFNDGENQLKAVGSKGGVQVTDDLQFRYQTQR